MTENKYILPESEIPKTWYNVVPDLPAPLAPGTDEVLRAGLTELRDSGEMPKEDCTL